METWFMWQPTNYIYVWSCQKALKHGWLATPLRLFIPSLHGSWLITTTILPVPAKIIHTWPKLWIWTYHMKIYAYKYNMITCPLATNNILNVVFSLLAFRDGSLWNGWKPGHFESLTLEYHKKFLRRGWITGGCLSQQKQVQPHFFSVGTWNSRKFSDSMSIILGGSISSYTSFQEPLGGFVFFQNTWFDFGDFH